MGESNTALDAKRYAFACCLFDDIVSWEPAFEYDEEEHRGGEDCVHGDAYPDHVAGPPINQEAEKEEGQGDFEADCAGDVEGLFCTDELGWCQYCLALYDRLPSCAGDVEHTAIVMHNSIREQDSLNQEEMTCRLCMDTPRLPKIVVFFIVYFFFLFFFFALCCSPSTMQVTDFST